MSNRNFPNYTLPITQRNSGQRLVQEVAGEVTVAGDVSVVVPFPSIQQVYGEMTLTDPIEFPELMEVVFPQPPLVEVLNPTPGTDVSGLATEETIATIADALSNRWGGGKTAVPFTVTTLGDNTIHTPASGKAIRLFSMTAITDPDQTTTPLIRVLFDATEVSRGYVISGWEIREGAADEPLVINLSEASSVSGTAYIKEFTP